MRPDGTRVRDLTAIMQALPYVMPKRYDAQNWAEENLDEDAIRDYIRAKRREGRSVTHMSLLVSAYYRAVLKNPKINYFVMNRRIYKRNHFCFSFVILKTRADGTPDETSLKVYLEPEDTVFTVTEKIRSTIEKNQNVRHNNDTDRFAKFAFGVPGLARAVFALAIFLDRHNLLPRSIIELSPFHTSLFVTNLASINTPCIFHHCYEFGTTSVFVCMGKPVPNFLTGEYNKKIMPLGIVMDERICTGHEYALFWQTLRRYLKHPELTRTARRSVRRCRRRSRRKGATARCLLFRRKEGMLSDMEVIVWKPKM